MSKFSNMNLSNKNDWSKGHPRKVSSLVDDEKANKDNLNLLIVS